jgi:sterol 3beta-glucosyltransferase
MWHLLAPVLLVAASLQALAKQRRSLWGDYRLETPLDWLAVACELLGSLVRLAAVSPSAGTLLEAASPLIYLPIALSLSWSLAVGADGPASFSSRLLLVLMPGSDVAWPLFAAALGIHVLFGIGRQPHGALRSPRAPGDGGAKPLRILVLTIGTRGDVQPFVALGQELQRRGHRVTICAFGTHQGLVERYGLDYASAGLDGIEQDAVSWRQSTHVSDVMKYSLPDFAKNFVLLGTHFFRAAQDKDVLIVVSTVQSFAYSIAEKLRLPVWVVKLAPDVPTRAFPPPNYRSSGWGLGNLLQWYHHWALVAMAARDAKMGVAEDEFRETVLGLGKLKGGKRIGEMTDTPTLCAFSSAVIPTPRDWGGNSIGAGWFLSSQATPTHRAGLPRALVDFLGAERDVVCITFGSMFPAADGVGLVELIALAALAAREKQRQAGPLRVLVIRPPGRGQTYQLPGHVVLFEVDEAPHDLVFPLCGLVVHHGGAGTSASVLESATPAIVVPILLWTDQPLWAERLQALGVALHVRQRLALASPQTLDSDRARFLADCERAIASAPAMHSRCAELASVVKEERGVHTACDAIEAGMQSRW